MKKNQLKGRTLGRPMLDLAGCRPEKDLMLQLNFSPQLVMGGAYKKYVGNLHRSAGGAFSEAW